MTVFKKSNKESKNNTTFEDQLKNQADRFGLAISELKKLGVGKSCPKYGMSEVLHVRKVRGGKVIVFNISERYRSEKISEGRKKTKT